MWTSWILLGAIVLLPVFLIAMRLRIVGSSFGIAL